MTVEVVDISYARPSPSAIKAKYPGVIRYVSPDPPSGKIITKAEATALWAEGLSIALVAEGNSAGWMRRGTDYAKVAAGICRAQARAAGFPDSLSIYLAADEDFQASDQPMLDAFLRAWTEADTVPASVYGGYYVITRCQANKSALRFWQASAWSTDSATHKILVAPGIHLFQTLDKDFWSGGQPGADIDIVYAEDYGQWPKPEGGTPVTDWVSEMFGTKVERVEMPRPGGAPYYHVSETGKGVLHTTEGPTVDGAISTLKSKFSAPTFIVGEDRIVQCRPLWAQGAALHTGVSPYFNNAIAQVQIEVVGYSKTDLWLPLPPSLDPLLKVMAWCSKNLGIPLQVPNGWPDDNHDMPMPWAADNKRRQSRLFYTGDKGWYGHIDVPLQAPTWHWDPGSCQRTGLMERAKALLGPPQPEEDWMATLFDTQDEFKNAVREALVGSKSGGGPIISAADAGFGTRLSAAIYHRVADKIGSNKVDDVAAALMAKLGF